MLLFLRFSLIAEPVRVRLLEGQHREAKNAWSISEGVNQGNGNLFGPSFRLVFSDGNQCGTLLIYSRDSSRA